MCLLKDTKDFFVSARGAFISESGDGNVRWQVITQSETFFRIKVTKNSMGSSKGNFRAQ